MKTLDRVQDAKSSWRISKRDHGKSLPEVLQDFLKLPSLKKARKLIDKGCCSVNGKIRRFASCKVSCNDLIEVVPIHEEAVPTKPIATLFENDDFLIIDKPPGIIVDESLIKKSPAFSSCHLVHRLDKDTSGALLIAKNSKAKEHFLELFRKRLIKKEYIALVDGYISQNSGVISKPLEEKKRLNDELFWGVAPHGRGKEAVTEYVVIRRAHNATLVKLFPRTGRTHQIRVHMASLGHPILGDYKYGESFISNIRPSRHLLHALSLTIPMPNGTADTYISPVPPDFDMVVKDLFGATYM